MFCYTFAARIRSSSCADRCVRSARTRPSGIGSTRLEALVFGVVTTSFLPTRDSVLQTTQISPGVIVMGNLEIATQTFIREGITLNMSNISDDFTNGRVKIRAIERLTLGVARPTALNILTGF